MTEDIAQDAFLWVRAASDQYKPKARFKTYLFTIIQNLCIDHIWKEQRLEHDCVPDPLFPDYPHEKLIDRIEVEKRLALLPDLQRKVFELFYLKEKSYKEIALILNITEKAVGNILYEWIKKIQ